MPSTDARCVLKMAPIPHMSFLSREWIRWRGPRSCARRGDVRVDQPVDVRADRADVGEVIGIRLPDVMRLLDQHRMLAVQADRRERHDEPVIVVAVDDRAAAVAARIAVDDQLIELFLGAHAELVEFAAEIRDAVRFLVADMLDVVERARAFGERRAAGERGHRVRRERAVEILRADRCAAPDADAVAGQLVDQRAGIGQIADHRAAAELFLEEAVERDVRRERAAQREDRGRARRIGADRELGRLEAIAPRHEEAAKGRVVFDGDARVREIVDRRMHHRRRGDVIDHVDLEIALADRAEIEQAAQELRALLARHFGVLAERARRAHADRQPRLGADRFAFDVQPAQRGDHLRLRAHAERIAVLRDEPGVRQVAGDAHQQAQHDAGVARVEDDLAIDVHHVDALDDRRVALARERRAEPLAVVLHRVRVEARRDVADRADAGRERRGEERARRRALRRGKIDGAAERRGVLHFDERRLEAIAGGHGYSVS
ncbi:hypothetical protein BURPS1710b_0901 [Burkholderia pseudomallei 1710b]|uniref:Uncharacterized protein n=1 Tax=Burkholderia pseudomallei (strain 1710b) TaxID=320372 RepID=Q3JVT9_BURP1|nr:hypothetical protein BURPS1710b_0901 [Burkholderia pseudomallei 1710b]